MKEGVGMKALVFINPSSGKEKGKDYKESIVTKLEEYFEEVKTVIVEGLEDVDRAMDEAGDLYDALFAAGGDGTVNMSIGALAKRKSKMKFGIFPGGTGNDLARILGIPTTMEEAIEHFNPSNTKKIDIGKINGRYFALRVTIGTIADALSNVSSEDKDRFGALSYVMESIKSFQEEKVYPIQVETEDEIYRGKVAQIVIALKTSVHGIQYSHEEREGMITLFLLGDSSFTDKISIVGMGLQGKLEEHDKIKIMQGKKIKISCIEEEIPCKIDVDVDGEEGPFLPLELSILENAIEVYIP